MIHHQHHCYYYCFHDACDFFRFFPGPILDLNDACGVYGDGDDVHDECELKLNLNCSADPPALPTFDGDDVCGR